MGKDGAEMMRIVYAALPWVIVGFLVVPPEPADDWFKVSSITIADSVVGEPITMNVARVIHRPFLGEWTAAIRRIRPEGVEIVCNISGVSSYKIDAVYPHPLTLDWWTYPIQCKLPPGQYRLDTAWRFEVGHGVKKVVTAESNVFIVWDATVPLPKP